MELSRREFLRLSVAAGTGTALGGLLGSALTRSGRRAGAGAADQGREGHPERLPLLLGRVRARSSTPSTARSSTSRAIRAARTTRARSAPRARRSTSSTSTPTARRRCCTAKPGADRVGGVGPRAGDGPRRRAGEEDARRDVHRAAAQRQARQHDARHLLPGRRHARQRVEPHPPEAHARPGHRRHREPGPNMTQLQRPRSGDAARSRRGDDVPAQHGGLRLHRHQGLEHGGVPPGGVPLADEGQGRDGAKLIHVDPRFTRTSAMADIHAPIRAGSDIAFLGGLINYVHQQRAVEHGAVLPRVRRQLHERRHDRQRGLPGHRGSRRRLLRPHGVHGEAAGVAVQRLRRRSTNARSWQYDRHQPAQELAQPRAAASRAAGAVRRQSPRQLRPRPEAALRRRWSRRSLQAAARAGRDAAGSALRLPDREAALRALHAGDGRAGDRLPPGSSSRSPRPFWPTPARPHDVVRLRRRLDPAHQRRPDDRLLRAAAAPARQHGPARRRHHGAARPRHDPGLDRRADALPLDPRLHAAPVGAQEARDAAGLPRRRDAADRATGPTCRSSWCPTSSRCTATPRPRRTTSATTGTPRSSATTRTCRCSPRWPRAG